MFSLFRLVWGPVWTEQEPYHGQSASLHSSDRIHGFIQETSSLPRSTFARPLHWSHFVISKFPEDLQLIFDLANNSDPFTSRTMEIHVKETIPFFHASISYVNGKFISNWFTKLSYSNIITNEKSAHLHPYQMQCCLTLFEDRSLC